MSLISCQSISKTFGARPLFERLSFTIAEGERIGLIGPNGAGKSTLVQMLAGLQNPDKGTIAFRKNLRLGYVPQESTFTPGLTIKQVVMEALAKEPLDDEEKDAKSTVTLGKVGFEDFGKSPDVLSGGWRKRLSMARELVREPDVLLLDEPTNHLDMEGIWWLEKLLRGSRFACLTVSHDRYFLENIANNIAEINRIYPDGIFRASGSYSEFLLKRDEFQSAQEKHKESLENRVRREVEWLRRGPKARTTKSKARIDSAGKLIGELDAAQARSVTGSARIDFAASGRQTKKLVVGEGLSKKFGDRVLFEDVEINLRPGVRLGLVGANGSGKTTLLRLIEGSLPPDEGTIERAENLRIAYFDQHREQLDPNMPLRRALCPHGDTVIYREQPIHVASWANRFLFKNEQLDLAVRHLSGGERARVAIAQLMLKPADLLLLDEPTNDLDIQTLEILEDSLLDFPGALALVTHDRYLLDRVCTTVLAIENGSAQSFADYSQWEVARTAGPASQQANAKAPVTPAVNSSETAKPGKKRLSYQEAREWEGIEAKIHAAEAELSSWSLKMQDPEFTSDPRRLQEAYDRMQAAQAVVDSLFTRWSELEQKLQPETV